MDHSISLVIQAPEHIDTLHEPCVLQMTSFQALPSVAQWLTLCLPGWLWRLPTPSQTWQGHLRDRVQHSWHTPVSLAQAYLGTQTYLLCSRSKTIKHIFLQLQCVLWWQMYVVIWQYSIHIVCAVRHNYYTQCVQCRNCRAQGWLLNRICHAAIFS